jgi:hypothetical protein
MDALEAQVLAKIATLSDKKNHNRKYSRCFHHRWIYLRIGDKHNASVANRLQVLKRE